MPGMGSGEKRMNVPGELVRRCQQGEPDAQRALFEQTVRDVHRMLHRLAGPGADIEDLVQQVYLALYSSIGRFEGRSAFSTWLFGICIRVAKKGARGMGRFSRLRSALRAEKPVSGQLPDERVERVQEARVVHETLARLAYKHRTVLVLYEMEGLSGKEIAESLSIPEATVWTRLHHARKAFRRSFPWETTRKQPSAPS
jgi:RNA polymerase sigma-70 factor, ECF subfamily